MKPMSSRWPAVLLIGALLAAPTAGMTADAAPGDMDQIVMKGFLWGRPTTSWEINRDGSGWVTSRRDGRSFNEFTLVTKRWGPSSRAFEQVKTALVEAERFAGRKLPCRNMVTDGPYGAVTWRTGGTIETLNYSFGCMSPTSERVFATFATAWTEIQNLSAGAIATEELVTQ
jgi:hypothetical protein